MPIPKNWLLTVITSPVALIVTTKSLASKSDRPNVTSDAFRSLSQRVSTSDSAPVSPIASLPSPAV